MQSYYSGRQSGSHSAASKYLQTALAKSSDSNLYKKYMNAQPPLTLFSKEDNSESEEEVERETKFIDDQVVFKAAMTSNYSKLTELSIVSQGITAIDAHN